MEIRNTKLALTASALAMALMLAGCGGGGSSGTASTASGTANTAIGGGTTSTTTTDDTPPAPAPEPVTLPELPMGDMYAFALADGEHTITAGQSLPAGGVMLECAAGGEDCVVTVDGTTVTSTGGKVMPKLTEMAQMALDKQKMTASQMKTQRATGQAAALSKEGTGMAPVFDATHGAGKAPSVSGSALSGFKAADEQPGMLGKFAGIARVNTLSSANTQHLVVYTDIAAPKLVEFFENDGDTVKTKALYGPNARAAPIKNVGDFILLTKDGPTTPGDNTVGKFSGGNVDSSIFPQKASASVGGSTPKKFSVNAKSDPDIDSNDRVSLPGTFDGARGTYICKPETVANGCTVSVSSSGAYSLENDEWFFAPADGSQAYREDSEYLTFGWWMSEPAKATGTYSFDTHYDGLRYGVTSTGDVTGVGVRGNATYTGNAAGRYVVSGEAGAFTADATLMAKFDDPQVGAVGSISGSITNFEGAADGMSGWSVELKKIDMADFIDEAQQPTPRFTAFQTKNIDSSSSRYDGTVAMVGDVTAHGTWQGAFFGNAKDPAVDGGGNTKHAAPLAVAGEFHADGPGVNIAGAFGARR